MKLITCENYAEMSNVAAKIMADQIKEKPNSILGLATGSTPEGMYAELVSMYKLGAIDFKNVQTFNLDEYYPIAPTSAQSYAYFMYENLFRFVNVKEDKRFIPNGQAQDVKAECHGYDEKILAAGGIDFQILGIGRNGHIGFNEPNDFFEAATHMVDLEQDTIEANARFFASPAEVPKHALTMGIQSIMMSRSILLLASGSGKAEAIYQALFGPITPRVPASILQLHPNITVLVDEEAFAEIRQHV